MNRKQQARLDALHRVQSFLDENAEALGDVNESTSRGALDDVLYALEERASTQGSAVVHAASATRLKHQLRNELRLYHMQPVAAIARSTLAHTPYITKMRLPPKDVNDSALIQAGYGMADAASQYREVFVAERLPVDFIEQLRASVEAVRKAAVTRDGFQVGHTQATQGVSDDLTRAHNVVAILNALVVKQLKGRDDLLAGWRRAKHARAKPGVPQGTVVGAIPSEATSARRPGQEVKAA
jgi:hypothetical protein